MLTLVERPDLPRALAAALRPSVTADGGSAVAPLPGNPVERSAACAMLRPEVPLAEPDAAAVVVTSGSSGRPKGVVLSRAAMLASVRSTHERLGGAGDWLLALPSHYVAGLMVHARAIVAGTGLHDIGTDLAGLADAVGRTSRRTYLSVVATQLSRALAEPELTDALSRVDAVLLGGGPAPGDLLDRAREARIRVVTTYGMSETCGGCVYDGVPLEGVGIEVGTPDGRVTVSGQMLFSGYRLRPELTGEVLSGTRFRTSDRGRWRDGRLEILGRLDEVVISGGLNVDLAAVEEAARRWADQRSATVAVLGVPDAEWGTAVIAVTDAGEAELATLRVELEHSVPSYAWPKRLVHRSPIPRTAGGKIDRHRLRAELAPVSTDPAGGR